MMSSFSQNNVILNYIILTLLSYINFNLLIDFVTTRFYFTVNIPKSNPINRLLAQYIQNNPNLILYKKNAKIEKILENRKFQPHEKIVEGFLAGEEYTVIRYGWNLFGIKKIDLAMRSSEKDLSDLAITTYWGGESSIIHFLEMIKNKRISISTKIEFGRHNIYGDWYDSELIDSGKKIENIIMEENIKNAIVSDIREFIRSENWYHNNMLAHKRGYLFYGKPGCGKSSFVLALASEFRMTIREVKLQILSDESRLNNLFTYNNSSDIIYLLEDIDCIEINRESDKETEKAKKVSLSGLLNVLDGVAAAKNCIFIMTTNHIEKLDSALIRPGRIDKKFEFPQATHKEIAEYFYKVYKNTNLTPNFRNIMGDKKISMANVQGLLIQNKNDPHNFVEELKNLVFS